MFSASLRCRTELQEAAQDGTAEAEGDTADDSSSSETWSESLEKESGISTAEEDTSGGEKADEDQGVGQTCSRSKLLPAKRRLFADVDIEDHKKKVCKVPNRGVKSD